jgi:hypothetical protein
LLFEMLNLPLQLLDFGLCGLVWCSHVQIR